MYPVTTLRTMKIAAARSDKLMVFQKITYNPQAPKARSRAREACWAAPSAGWWGWVRLF